MDIKNVIIVVVDALRWDRVGAYNADSDITPNIDSVGESGTVFQNAFTTVNATDPAMTSLHTGRHPGGHGLINHGKNVTKKEKRAVASVGWLPEKLCNQGIETSWYGRRLGRWHFRGFDQHPNTESKVTDIENYLGSTLSGISPSLAKTASDIYNRVFDEQQQDDVIDKILKQVDDNQKHYSVLHLMDTHTPYEPDSIPIDEYYGKYESEDKPLKQVSETYPKNTWTREKCEKWSKKYEGQKGEVGTGDMNARYDASVKSADNKIGRLVKGLRNQGQLEESILFILSDHGESLTEHGILYDHHGLYDQTVRIPLVVRLPAEQSQTCTDLVQITDIAPTVSDYFEVPMESPVDGTSLRPLLEGLDEWERNVVLAEEAHTQHRKMVRNEDMKYIWAHTDNTVCRYCGIEHADKKELYNIIDDPTESENIAKSNRGLIKKLKQLDEDQRDKLTQPVYDVSNTVEYQDEEEVLERLEDLGYR